MNASALPELPAALRSLGVRREFAPGTVIFTAGSDVAGMYLITEGHVRILRGGGGRAHVVHEEGPGGTIGEVPLFAGGRYPATAIAAVRTRCLLLTHEDVRHAVRTDPEIAMALLQRLSLRVRLLVDQLDSRTAQGTRQRLAALLLQRSGPAPNPQATPQLFTLGATQQEIAESIGTVRELVVRGLRELRNEAVIATDGRGRYSVLDRDRLESIASA